MLFLAPPTVFSYLCFAKIGCGSDKAWENKFSPAFPLTFRYLWLRPRLRRLGNAKENELFLGAALAFRYFCCTKIGCSSGKAEKSELSPCLASRFSVFL